MSEKFLKKLGAWVACGYLAGAATACCMGFIAVWPGLPLGWLKSQEAAAWVQAIGSIGAILVAVAVPVALHLSSDRVRAEDARLRAKSLAIVVLPGIADAQAVAKSRLNEIRNLMAYAAKGNTLDPEWEKRFGVLGDIPMPPELIASIDRLHLLGSPVGEAIQTAVSLSAQYNRELARQHVRGRGLGFAMPLLELAAAGASAALTAAAEHLFGYLDRERLVVAQPATPPAGSGSAPQPAPSPAGRSVGPSSS